MAAQHPGELTPLVTLRRHGLEIAGDEAIAAAAGRFAAGHVLHLPQFLGSDLLATFDARLPHAAFSTRTEDGIEIEQGLEDDALMGLLMLALNDPALFAVVRRLTGCGPIGRFTGRVQRRGVSDGRRHYYPWHTDAVEGRLVGLTLNLGAAPFEGGTLQMRRVGTDTLVAEAANHVRGDAFLFRISPQLEHHVTPVTRGSRLVLAGWFRDAAPFWA